MATFQVLRIGLVISQTADMDRATRFYRDCLGLTPKYESAMWTSFQIGETDLGLHPPFGESAPRGSGWTIGLEVSDVAAVKARLIEHGAEIELDYHDVPRGVILGFKDPDGNSLQAIQNGITIADLT